MRREHDLALVVAFGHTGFVRVRAPRALSQSSAKEALTACAEQLSCPVGEMLWDGAPKKQNAGSKEYVMLRPEHVACEPRLHGLQVAFCDVKRRVLRGLELGLELPPHSLLERHADDNDAIRLLRYPPGQRCEGPMRRESC